MNEFNLITHIENQIKFSKETFGPGSRTEGVIEHIKKELEEIRENPQDIKEWIDVMILAMDGAWRAGYTAEEICTTLKNKLEENKKRSWPDWRTAPKNKPIEHNRT